MAVLTVATIDRSANVADLVAALVAAAGGGDSFANTGAQFLVVNNGSGSPITVTEVCQATVDGQTVTNKTRTVAAGKIALMGPYPTGTYNDGNSRMNFTYSAVVTVTVGAFQLTTS